MIDYTKTESFPSLGLTRHWICSPKSFVVGYAPDRDAYKIQVTNPIVFHDVLREPVPASYKEISVRLQKRFRSIWVNYETWEDDDGLHQSGYYLSLVTWELDGADLQPQVDFAEGRVRKCQQTKTQTKGHQGVLFNWTSYPRNTRK